MNQNSMPGYLPFIHQQIASQEQLLDYHFKLEALLDVVLASNLRDHSYLTMHNYLYTLSDLVEQATYLSEALLNDLLRALASIESPETGPGDSSLH